MSAHEFKREVLGKNANISRYDVYRDGDKVYLVGKQTNEIIDTGYRLSGGSR